MNRAPFLAAAALAAVLGLTILIELVRWGAGSGAGSGAAAGAAAGAGPAGAIDPAASGGSPHGPPSAANAAAALDGWVSTILARPLFSPSRRPGQAVVASTELPRLAGIIIGPDGARAIFATSGDRRAIVAGPGGHAGPYLIRAVDRAGVAVTGPDGERLLHPAYDPNAAAGSTAIPGSAMPGQPQATGGTSILDLLRSRVQAGSGGLRPLLAPPAAPPPRSQR